MTPIVVGHHGEERKVPEKIIVDGEPFPVEVGAGYQDDRRAHPASQNVNSPSPLVCLPRSSAAFARRI